MRVTIGITQQVKLPETIVRLASYVYLFPPSNTCMTDFRLGRLMVNLACDLIGVF